MFSLAPFFRLAAVSPSRRSALRGLAFCHVAVLLLASWSLFRQSNTAGALLLGNVVLIAGIVEGALLIGWRLTQLPKSQALEFLLVSPIRPHQTFLAETLVGMARLAIVALSGLPVLALLWAEGLLDLHDWWVLVLMPYIWGVVTGLGLTVWAYEPPAVRKWGERFVIVGILLYLVVGVLAGEQLGKWLSHLPPDLAAFLFKGFKFLHFYNPFGVMKWAMEQDHPTAWFRIRFMILTGLCLIGLLMLRGSMRLQGHFRDRHYRPILNDDRRIRPEVGDEPLSWWAVKRVSEYSGRINLWLAGGFGVLYAIYTLFKADWPAWLGRSAFDIFDQVGGIPVLSAALVLLAAVPAAYQYGLWDSNAQDRCRRLELLLLTNLDGRAYWQAAAAAAWKRGRGYFLVAGLLWWAAWWSGQMSGLQVLWSAAAGVILWGLYFALGFRAFSRGQQANLLGLMLTIGLPAGAFVLTKLGMPLLAGLLPPGTLMPPSWDVRLAGPMIGAVIALVVGQQALATCEQELRRWYEVHHGRAIE